MIARKDCGHEVLGLLLGFVFCKQKRAYEIYRCDWSSDVCSSDLISRAISLARKYSRAGECGGEGGSHVRWNDPRTGFTRAYSQFSRARGSQRRGARRGSGDGRMAVLV